MKFIQKQPAILPELDPKADLPKVVSVNINEVVGDPKPEVRMCQIPEVAMSAQRKRRAQRMARRPLRLVLGPSSEHAAEIAKAIQLVEEKNGPIDGTYLESNLGPRPKSSSIVQHEMEGVQSSGDEGSSTEDRDCLTNTTDVLEAEDRSISEDQSSLSSSNDDEGSSAEDRDCLTNTTSDLEAEDRSISEDQSSLSSFNDDEGSSTEYRACLTSTTGHLEAENRSISEDQSSLSSDSEEKRDETEADDCLFSKVVPAEDACLLEERQPDTQSDGTDMDNVSDDAESMQHANVISQTSNLKEKHYRPEAIDSSFVENNSEEVSVDNEETLSGSSIDQEETTKTLSPEALEDETILTEPEAIVIGKDDGKSDTDGTDDLPVTINELTPKESSARYFKHPR